MPESVTSLAEFEPPSEKSPATVTALASVRAAESDCRLPPLTVSVPVPSAALLSTKSVPAERLTPVVNVLEAESTKLPEPAFVIAPPADEIVPEIRRSSGDRPDVVITGVALENTSDVPEIVGVVAGLSFTAVIAPEPDSVNCPPSVTVGVVTPPRLSKDRPASVLVPNSVIVPPPRNRTLLVGAI